MGKFFITSSRKNDNTGREIFKKSGFEKYERIERPKYFINIYKKRKIENENLYILDNGDFAGVNGTCIYKGKIGKESLANIYNDFNNNISNIRKNAIGHYVIFIKKGNNIKIFNDKYNVYRVYYYISKESWFISNSLKAVAETLNRRIINKYRLFEKILQVNIMGKEEFYKGIYRLFGNEVLEINTKSGNIVINKFGYQRETYDLSRKSLVDCVNIYIPCVKEVFSLINEVFGDNIAIEQTGGLDTRTVFSALNSVGGKARLLFGISYNRFVRQHEADLEIVANLSKKFNRDLYIMNWRGDCKINENLYEYYFKKYGFYFKIYGCNENYFKEYEGLIPNYPKLFMNGLYGENLKERKWLNEVLENSIDIKKIVSRYFIPAGISRETFKAKNDWKEYKNYLESELLSIAQNIYHIKIINNKVDKNNFNELDQIYTRCTHPEISNFQNQFSYSLSPFGIAKIYEFLFNVPYEYKKDGRFQFELIKALDRTTLDIPIYSHCRPVSIEQGKLLIEKRSFIKIYLKNYHAVYNAYKKLRNIMPDNRGNHISRDKFIRDKLIVAEYQNYLKNNSFLAKYFNIDRIINPLILSRMVLYTFAINKIGFSSIE